MPSLVELLVDELDEDLARRRREIVDLRTLALGASESRLARLARVCQVMAYAHWEGFAKKAFSSYLTHLTKLNLTVERMREPLQALIFMQDVRRAASDAQIGPAVDLLRAYEARAGSVFILVAKDIVRTGNLDSSAFRRLVEASALDYLPYYETRENFIDHVLCGRRHRIVHGEWQPVSDHEMDDVVSGTLELCDQLNFQIQEAAIYEHFRK
jgi:hypothetical protein